MQSLHLITLPLESLPSRLVLDRFLYIFGLGQVVLERVPRRVRGVRRRKLLGEKIRKPRDNLPHPTLLALRVVRLNLLNVAQQDDLTPVGLLARERIHVAAVLLLLSVLVHKFHEASAVLPAILESLARELDDGHGNTLIGGDLLRATIVDIVTEVVQGPVVMLRDLEAAASPELCARLLDFAQRGGGALRLRLLLSLGA